MSGSRWVITPSWLSGSWISFLYSSSVYSCHLFLISSASIRSLLFLSLFPSLNKCSLGVSNFLEEISSFSHSLVFLYFFALITEKPFLPLLAFLWNSALRWKYLPFSPLPFASLPFSAICKAFWDNHFAFLHFFFLEMVLITASCTISWTSIHSCSGTLSYLIPWIYLSLPLYNHKAFDLSPTWMV